MMSFGNNQSEPNSPYRRLQPRRAVKSISSTSGMHRSDSTTSNGSRYSADDNYRARAFSSSRMSSGSGSDVDEIRFTKTGRVSRALKGKRVHACELCDKVCILRLATIPSSDFFAVLHKSRTPEVCQYQPSSRVD